MKYFDLSVTVLQGTAECVSSIKDTVNQIVNVNYDVYVKSRAIIIENCSNLAKNTLSRGVCSFSSARSYHSIIV